MNRTRILITAFWGLFLGWALSVSPDGTKPVFAGSPDQIKLPPITREVFPNGLKVIVIEHHELPIVSFRLVFRTGTKYDPIGKAGLTNLTAGLLRKGTRTRSATQIAEEIDFVGGSLDAGANTDATYGTCQLLSKWFDTGLDLLSDIVMNPVFADEEIERLRQQTIAGIIQSKEDPNNVVEENFRKLLFGDHPLGQPLIGIESSVKSITRADIVNFHKQYYVPNNAILAVVGDVKTSEVLTKVKAKFGNWQRGTLPLANFPPYPVIKGFKILLVDKPDLTQTNIKIGHFGIPRNSPDAFPCRLMNYILGGGGFASRLMAEIRSKRGLTYGVNSQFDFGKEPGAWAITTFTRNDSTLQAIKGILDEVQRIRNQKVSDQELQDAKNFYNGYFPLRFETPEQIATQILDVELYNLGDNFIRDYRKNISAVTTDDILRAAKKYLDPENLCFTVVSKASDVKAKLETLGQVQVKSFAEKP